MIRLSVNVNKVATLRNSRGGELPNLLRAVQTCLAAGVRGITVHPREDQRHITPEDVGQIAELLREPANSEVEYNIEGDPRPDWLELVHAIGPAQATLVPVRAGEVTSEAGWSPGSDGAQLRQQVEGLRAAGIRVSLFVEARVEAVRWAADVGADRIELYTGPFAQAFARGQGEQAFAAHVEAANAAHALGLGVNAGHDLDLDNLVLYRTLPHLVEVSIGHALMAEALFEGLGSVVRKYLAAVAG